MHAYTVITKSLTTLTRPHQAVYAALCAVRYVPLLAALDPSLVEPARAYTDLVIDSVGEVADDRLDPAIDEVEELIPHCGDAAHSHYWVGSAFSMVLYALEAAHSSVSEDAGECACAGGLGIAGNIDFRLAARGFRERLWCLEISAQASSIRQLAAASATGIAPHLGRLRLEAAAFGDALSVALPVFQRTLTC